MKRFGFDWENNRALKFDDYFKFPLILNMEPYTLDGVNKRESFVEHDDSITNNNGNINNETLINSSSATTGIEKKRG
jgi:ubiquitin carboxyl-terminal hydrolase 9/24